MGRSTPGTFSKRAIMPRPRTCGCSRISGTLRIRPAGTPASLSAASQAAAGRAASAASSSAVNAARLSRRAWRVSNRGSSIRSGRPTTRATASNCACLLAAIFNGASAQAKAPDGLAVTLSLPSGAGAWPATRWFDTAQPMVASTEASMETSTVAPSPERSRPASAAAIANAAVRPPTVSAMG